MSEIIASNDWILSLSSASSVEVANTNVTPKAAKSLALMSVVAWPVINPKDRCSSGPANRPRCDHPCNDLSRPPCIPYPSLGSDASSLGVRDRSGHKSRSGFGFAFRRCLKARSL